MIRTMSLLFILLIVPLNSLWAQSTALESFERQDYDAAIQAWDELLKENPELKGINYNKGNARFRKGEFDEAISSYEQALGEEDKDALADIYYNMGNAWLYKQEIEKAREFYKQALRLRPGDVDAKTNLELLNHLPPPPPQDQNSEQNQDDQEQQENEEQQQDQNSDSQDQNEEQQDQEQEQDESEGEQEEQQNQEEEKTPEEQKQDPNVGEEETDPEELMNAEQLLDALKDRETENMREQIKLKTSGADQEKDW